MANLSSQGGVPAPASKSTAVLCGRTMEAVYHVPMLQPKAPGAWRLEFEKVAWTDATTGLPCIIRRMAGGFLAGFVAVPSGHPLYGWSAEAVPASAVHIHGGLNYARPCDSRGPEDTSICHVRADKVRDHDDAWWLGFSCNGLADLIPDDSSHANEALRLGIEQEYRNVQYVFDQCTSLAHDLSLAGESQ
jgi:hypothetical protein